MAKAPQKRPTADGLIPVTLSRPHVHEGRQLKAGAVIVVSPARADWLRRQELIEPPEPEPEPSPPPTPENKSWSH